MSARPPTSTVANGRGLASSIESLADGAGKAVQQLRDKVEPNATRWAQQAEELANRSLGAVRDGSERLRSRALSVTDRGMQYVQDEPVKAVLIAAAAGALLVALFGSRSSRRSR